MGTTQYVHYGIQNPSRRKLKEMYCKVRFSSICFYFIHSWSRMFVSSKNVSCTWMIHLLQPEIRIWIWFLALEDEILFLNYCLHLQTVEEEETVVFLAVVSTELEET